MSPRRDLRLLELSVEGFGRLRDWTLRPSREPGALIVAPNEAGKSTLAAALVRVLFGFADKSLEDAFRPWEGGPYVVASEWALDGTTTCRIRRDFDTQEVEVEWRTGGALDGRWQGEPNPRGRSNDLEAYEAHLRRLLGFTSRQIFRQTVFVGASQVGSEPLAGELLRLLSGSERADFKAALVAFEAEWSELTRMDIADPRRPTRRAPRDIEVLEERRVDLEQRRRESRRAQSTRREVEEELEAVRDRLAEVDRERASRDETVAELERLRDIRAEVVDVERRIAELDRMVERFRGWEDRVREKTRALEPLVRYLRMPDDFSSRLGRLERSVAERERVRHELDRLEERRDACDRARGHVVALAAGALLVVVATGLALGVDGMAGLAGGVATGVVGLLLLGWGGWRIRERRGTRREIDVERTARQRALEGIDGDIATLAGPLEGDPGRVDYTAERERFDAALRLKSELDVMQRAREDLGDRDQVERERLRLKEERLDVLRLERRRILERRPFLDAGPEWERDFLDAGGRLDRERKRLEEEELGHRRRLADLPSVADDPHRLAAEIERLEERADRLTLERDAYGLAHRTLEACRGEFLELMTRRLAGRVGGVVEELTEGRYAGVAIDPVTLAVRVHGVEKRDVPAESLSRGTRDQLAFAIRVAVLEEFARDRTLPLVLDDPFLHFDRRRLARVERTLERLGRRHQVLLLTHDARVALWRTFPRRALPGLAEPAAAEGAAVGD